MTGRARALLSVGLGLVLLTPVAHPGLAQAVEPSGRDGHEASAHPDQGTAEAVAAARVHFTKGRALYQAGAYREAIVELDAARALDPKAKDLVFNLGVVHEKLGEIDEALRYARLYAQMDLEPGERTRAESYIKRLEGAKSEVAAREAAAAAAMRPVPGADVARVRGRLDAATITASGVAVVAAGVGVVMGIKALGDKPASGFVAGVNGTAADLANETSTAHSDAVVADICFAGAIVAAGAAAGLYFGRYRDAPSAPKHAQLIVAPLVAPSLGGVLLGGSF